MVDITIRGTNNGYIITDSGNRTNGCVCDQYVASNTTQLNAVIIALLDGWNIVHPDAK